MAEGTRKQGQNILLTIALGLLLLVTARLRFAGADAFSAGSASRGQRPLDRQQALRGTAGVGLAAFRDSGDGMPLSPSASAQGVTWRRAIPPERRLDKELEMQRVVETMMNEGLMALPEGTSAIFVVSDSTGETAKLLMSRLLVQFEDVQPIVRIFAYVSTPERLAEVLSQANENTLIFATLVDPTSVGWLERLSREKGVPVVDVMTPLLNQLGTFLESESVGVPGMGISQQRIDGLVSKEFFGMVEATQFVHETAFGLNRVEWPQADVALVGVGKVGKTGVAVSLAQRGVKAVCVNVALDKPIPEELKTMKVIVLTMQEEELAFRRENHIIELARKNMSMIADANMISPSVISEEIRLTRRLQRENPHWLGPIDCTYKDEAELSSEIIIMLRKASKEAAEEPPLPAGGLPMALALVPALAAAAAVLSQHALPTPRAAAAGRAPTLAGGSLPRAGPLQSPRAAITPVVRLIGQDRRIKMEEEMRRAVDDEVASEDPDMRAVEDKTIYVLSDSSGQTAKLLITRLLVQFRSMKPVIRMRANIRTPEQLETVVDEVSSAGPSTLIFATLVDPVLEEMFKDLADKMAVTYIDVMSPLLTRIGDFLNRKASRVAGGATAPKEIMDVELFNRVDAVKYAQQHVLGLNQKDWKNADVLIIGLSRVGKVSLAFYLAQYGFKAACADVRPDVKLPSQLFELNPKKVLVVEMDANMLARKRRARLEHGRSKNLPMLFDPDYADLARIQTEAQFLSSIVKQNPGWLGPLNLTHLAIEERASIILRTLREASVVQAPAD